MEKGTLSVTRKPVWRLARTPSDLGWPEPTVPVLCPRWRSPERTEEAAERDRQRVAQIYRKRPELYLEFAGLYAAGRRVGQEAVSFSSTYGLLGVEIRTYPPVPRQRKNGQLSWAKPATTGESLAHWWQQIEEVSHAVTALQRLGYLKIKGVGSRQQDAAVDPGQEAAREARRLRVQEQIDAALGRERWWIPQARRVERDQGRDEKRPADWSGTGRTISPSERARVVAELRQRINGGLRRANVGHAVEGDTLPLSHRMAVESLLGVIWRQVAENATERTILSVCRVCGKAIVMPGTRERPGRRQGIRYCSSVCKQRAYRHRRPKPGRRGKDKPGRRVSRSRNRRG